MKWENGAKESHGFLPYSQLCALLGIQISPIYMQIQRQVEANPAEMKLLSL